MKKIFFLLCFFCFPILAQEIADNTFNENNPNLVYDNEAKVYSGGSFVYIQGISDKPQPKTWMDKAKIRLFGSMDIPQRPDAPQLNATPSFDNQQKEIGIPVNSFFGKSKEVKYIPHTSDWNFIIQLMDGQNIYVQEHLQFLTTQDTPIVRSWPIDSKHFFLISAKINGQNIKPFLEKTSDLTSLKLPLTPKGIHKIILEYVLYNPKNSPEILLPLTASDWSLVVDNMSGIILANQNLLENIKFLFGQNKLEIPSNFNIQTDDKGNTFFQNNHIIPAFAQIYLSAKNVNPQNEDNALNNLSPFSLFLISFIIMLCYFSLSGYEIHARSLLYQLKRFKKHSENAFISWLYRMGEIVIGVFILLTLTLLISLFLKINLSFFWALLLISAILGIILLDIFIFYPKQKEIFKIYKKQQ
ncbi:MAG: hypothetical protein E7021_02985 [Alphaproteobacteria bacterium]|nr:hypothetical protein [Alphaproteobacteria bacterium]